MIMQWLPLPARSAGRSRSACYGAETVRCAARIIRIRLLEYLDFAKAPSVCEEDANLDPNGILWLDEDDLEDDEDADDEDDDLDEDDEPGDEDEEDDDF